MKINRKICGFYAKDIASYKRKLAIADDYVKIYRNKRLSARTAKSRMAYYRKQKKWENRIIKLKRIIAREDKIITACKRYDFL